MVGCVQPGRPVHRNRRSRKRSAAPIRDGWEVWVNGPNVARAAVPAQRAGDGVDVPNRGRWNLAAPGDLSLDAAGELYITGRIKDVIIIRGINHYPQDIEDTVQSSRSVRRNGGAAFRWSMIPGPGS